MSAPLGSADLSRLLALIAHDIRSPVNVLSGAVTEVTAMGASGDATADIYYRLMRRSVDLLTELALNVATLAEVAGGTVACERAPVDLTELLQELTVIVTSREPDRTVAFHSLPADGSIVVSTDPARLRHALGALMSSSLAASRTGIRVEVRPSEDHAVIRIEDDGPAVPSDQLPTLFERLPAPGQGHGRQGALPLLVAARLLTAMGARVSAESRPVGDGSDAGIAVSVQLPR